MFHDVDVILMAIQLAISLQHMDMFQAKVYVTTLVKGRFRVQNAVSDKGNVDRTARKGRTG